MIRICRSIFILAGILSASLAFATTIVKEDLVDVPLDKKNVVFHAFAEVPLYYLVTEKGGGIANSYAKYNPADLLGLLPKPPEGIIVTLYYSKVMAQQMKSISDKQAGTNDIIRSTTLENILQQQYERIGKAPVMDIKDGADFLVVDNIFQPSFYPEILIDKKTGAPYVITNNNGSFIPAFIATNELSIKLQNKLKAEGKDYNRVGMSFKEFLKMVQQYAESKTPIVVLTGDDSKS